MVNFLCFKKTNTKIDTFTLSQTIQLMVKDEMYPVLCESIYNQNKLIGLSKM